MAIPVKRFQFLDEETNVAVADFYNGSNTDILNSPMNELKTVDADMEEFIGNAVQSSKEQVWQIIPSTDTRTSTDSLGNLSDLENLAPKELTSKLNSLFPGNSLAQSAFSQLPSRCRNRAGSRGGSGRPYGQSNNCNGNSRPANGNCGSGGSKQFGNAISQMTGGNYAFDFLDLDSMLGNITGLSAAGYSMNMCGVFGSLSQGVPHLDMLSKASGSLLGGLNSSNNVLGMLDLASSSGNLQTKLFNPSSITGMLSGFKFPTEIKQRNNSDLANRFTGAMEIFDNKWNQSSYDGRLSTQGVSNESTRSLMQQRALDNIYDENNLDVVPTDDYSLYSAAF